MCRSNSWSALDGLVAPSLRVSVQRPDQPVPSKWKRLMSLDENKMDLVKVFANYWSSTPFAVEGGHSASDSEGSHVELCAKL